MWKYEKKKKNHAPNSFFHHSIYCTWNTSTIVPESPEAHGGCSHWNKQVFSHEQQLPGSGSAGADHIPKSQECWVKLSSCYFQGRFCSCVCFFFFFKPSLAFFRATFSKCHFFSPSGDNSCSVFHSASSPQCKSSFQCQISLKVTLLKEKALWLNIVPGELFFFMVSWKRHF